MLNQELQSQSTETHAHFVIKKTGNNESSSTHTTHLLSGTLENIGLLSLNTIEFARKKKPSGIKNDRRTSKLPNHIRHDQNAAIAVGTWKKRGKSKA